MFFIILAFVILVVSFIAAFFSLVREQAKFEKQIDIEPSGTNSSVSSSKEKIEAPVKGQLDSELPILSATAGRSDATVVEEPFPWENRAQTSSIPREVSPPYTFDKSRVDIAESVSREADFNQDQRGEANARLTGEIVIAKDSTTSSNEK